MSGWFPPPSKCPILEAVFKEVPPDSASRDNWGECECEALSEKDHHNKKKCKHDCNHDEHDECDERNERDERNECDECDECDERNECNECDKHKKGELSAAQLKRSRESDE